MKSSPLGLYGQDNAEPVVKTSIRNFISRFPLLRFWAARWVFLRGRNTLRYWGVFRSFAQALSYIPRDLRDAPHPEIPDNLDENIPDADWEVVRILSTLIPKVRFVFDFGGHAGLSFYRYRKEIAYPPTLRWLVCDLPWMTNPGRRIAKKRGETQLDFTEDPLQGSGADIYLTFGTLQYLEESLTQMLSRLAEVPPHIIVNRVPMSSKETFFTLQHTDHNVIPYQIPNREEFISSIEAMGYELMETWHNDRCCDIIFEPDYFVKHYYGMYFRKKGV